MAKLLTRLGDESIVELTREGMAVGTPRYIAPEQARGQDIGPWTDLYALGLLFYEMLTGRQAVKSDTVEGAVAAHVSSEPLELEEIDQVPEDLLPVLHRLIDKNREERYQSAGQLIADVDSLIRDRGHALHSPESPGVDPRSGRVRGGASERAENGGAGAGVEGLEGNYVPDSEDDSVAALETIEQDSIELDWDRYDEYSEPQADPARPKRTSRRRCRSTTRSVSTRPSCSPTRPGRARPRTRASKTCHGP